MFLLPESMETLSVIHQYYQNHYYFVDALLLTLFILLSCCYKLYMSKPQHVYLVDFSCLKPPISCRVSLSMYFEHIRLFDFLDKQSVDYMSNLIASSGQGDETYLPPALFYIPPIPSHDASIDEVHMVLFPVLDDLLSKTNTKPSDIDILLVNCSGFCPSPSLSSIIINKYSMRHDIRSYTLSGMGCTASAIAIDLAQNLLKTHKNSNALILSTEILSTGLYQGKEISKLIINSVFRMGSAGILLSNKEEAKINSKYKLLFSLRTQTAFDNKSYTSAFREEDSSGFTGVNVNSESLPAVVGETVRSHIISLGSSILTPREKIRYVVSIARKCLMKTEIYVPNFREVIQHFCLPTSSKSMMRKAGKELKLGERELEGSLMTLHRFGNTSSSSMWYVLAYMEAKEKLKKGDKVWQLGLGTGFKCCSLIWESIGPNGGEPNSGPWADSISRYPI